jgi:phage-related protein
MSQDDKPPRPMPAIGRRVQEFRIDDAERSVSWRIVYRIDHDAILVVDWFEKMTPTTPATEIDPCRRRLREYDHGQEETS